MQGSKGGSSENRGNPLNLTLCRSHQEMNFLNLSFFSLSIVKSFSVHRNNEVLAGCLNNLFLCHHGNVFYFVESDRLLYFITSAIKNLERMSNMCLIFMNFVVVVVQ